MFGTIGLAMFSFTLISMIYEGFGFVDDDWSLEQQKSRYHDWLGMAFYITIDMVSSRLIGQVIQIPARNAFYSHDK